MALVRRPGMVHKPGTKVVHKTTNLTILHSQGKPSIYKTSWTVMGLPKVGKSTLASGFEDVLYLVTSEKEVGSLTVPYLLINSWERVLEVTDELINNKEKYGYKFIVIDFVDAVWTLCEIAVCKKLGVEHTTDAKYGKGSGMLKTFFRLWITSLVASDYGVVFVSHVNTKEVMSENNTVTKTVCSLSENARNILFPLVNVIACMEFDTVKVPQAGGKTALVKKRIIRFQGSEYVEAGDRDGVLPDKIVLSKDSKENFEIFKDYYEGRRKK